MWTQDSRLLVKLWMRTPLRIATAAPSGPRVSQAMAELANCPDDAWTLELGGGTGPVTAALLRAGVRQDRLLVVEQNPRLHALLRQRFSRVDVALADAGRINELLAERGIAQLGSVISTLPILTMPYALQQRILHQSFAAMGEGGHFIQITYMPGSPVPQARLRRWGYHAEIARFIATNLPPVAIWRYTWAGRPAISPGA